MVATESNQQDRHGHRYRSGKMTSIATRSRDTVRSEREEEEEAEATTILTTTAAAGSRIRRGVPTNGKKKESLMMMNGGNNKGVTPSMEMDSRHPPQHCENHYQLQKQPDEDDEDNDEHGPRRRHSHGSHRHDEQHDDNNAHDHDDCALNDNDINFGTKLHSSSSLLQTDKSTAIPSANSNNTKNQQHDAQRRQQQQQQQHQFKQPRDTISSYKNFETTTTNNENIDNNNNKTINDVTVGKWQRERRGKLHLQQQHQHKQKQKQQQQQQQYTSTTKREEPLQQSKKTATTTTTAAAATAAAAFMEDDKWYEGTSSWVDAPCQTFSACEARLEERMGELLNCNQHLSFLPFLHSNDKRCGGTAADGGGGADDDNDGPHGPRELHWTPPSCEYCGSKSTKSCRENCPRPKYYLLKKKPPFMNSTEGWDPVTEYPLNPAAKTTGNVFGSGAAVANTGVGHGDGGVTGKNGNPGRGKGGSGGWTSSLAGRLGRTTSPSVKNGGIDGDETVPLSYSWMSSFSF